MPTPKEDALRYTALAGLGGIGIGGILAYLASQANERPSKDTLNYKSPDMVNIPLPAAYKKNKQNLLRDSSDPTKKAGSFLSGDDASHWSGVPWLAPAAVSAAMLGGVGSNILVENILKKKRAKEREEELAEAEEGYNQALLNSYDPKKTNMRKMAVAEDISKGLTKLAAILKIAEEIPPFVFPVPEQATEQATEQAPSNKPTPANSFSSMAKGILGQSAGLAALLGLGIPAMSAYAAYNYYRSRDKTKLLNDAVTARQIRRLNENTPEPFVQIEE